MPGLVLTFTLSLLILGHCPPPTHANTEIINFPRSGRPVPGAPLPAKWTSDVVLNADTPEIIMRDITPAPRHAPCKDDGAPSECPHDLWLALDLDQGGTWSYHDHFTLRVSWPASHPASVALSVYPAPSAPHLARVRLTEEGVRAPTAHATQEDSHVPLVVRLEPLVLGVIPASVLPVIATLLLLLGVAACGVLPYVLRVVDDAVRAARRELALLERRKAA